jgi:hypothetical protein
LERTLRLESDEPELPLSGYLPISGHQMPSWFTWLFEKSPTKCMQTLLDSSSCFGLPECAFAFILGTICGEYR